MNARIPNDLLLVICYCVLWVEEMWTLMMSSSTRPGLHCWTHSLIFLRHVYLVHRRRLITNRESFERKLKEKLSTLGSHRILGDITNFTPVAERNTTAAIAKRRTASMDEFLRSPSKYKSVPGYPSACPDVLKIRVPQPTRPLDVLPQDLDSTLT
ncbi:hypothetical protein C8R41DRAFT_868219 [Lentinula lateritia]|uniref:Uncharacterized protein n=1 Tax=Lentinula lateritia TaxID=40482 RepID=A0ABQ8VBU5_9AGAR|nr:hypothetical protein C8R41DRAFT_868219 [Lentinula lateritia]